MSIKDDIYMVTEASYLTKNLVLSNELIKVELPGLDITLATPRKVSSDSHHECRNINWSRNDSPTPPVCSLQSGRYVLQVEISL